MKTTFFICALVVLVATASAAEADSIINKIRGRQLHGGDDHDHNTTNVSLLFVL